MGSTPPVRRFNAHRACVRCGLPHGRSRAESLLRFRAPSEASVAAPCGPADPWVGSSDRTTSPGLSSPFDTISERRRVTTAVPPAIHRPRTEVWLPPARPHHRPSRRAKRRSVHGLHPSGRSLRARRCLLAEALPSWRCRPPRRTVRCTRGRSRLQGLVLGTGPFVTGPCGLAVGALLGFPPPERSLHPSGHSALIARPPLAPHSRADVPARRSHRVSRSGWIGMVRFRTAGSHGVRHLLTVAALRSPNPGVGSWFHLARDARLSPPFLRSEPPGVRCSSWPGP
jgi:hypothetical protein